MDRPTPVPERLAVVALHDVAPATWPVYAPLVRWLDARGVALTLLVVPWWHGGRRITADRAFRAAMDARLVRGDELVMHGWRHVDEAPPPRGPQAWFRRRVLTAGEGEFAALDERAAQRRLCAARHAFARCGWPLHGFVAPAWQLGAGARAAVTRAGLAYTSDRHALYRLPDWTPLAAPALVASPRSAWRRACSRAWGRACLHRWHEAAVLRVALHPGDAAHPALRTWWQQMLGEVLETRAVHTKAFVCGRAMPMAPAACA